MVEKDLEAVELHRIKENEEKIHMKVEMGKGMIALEEKRREEMQ